MDNNTIEQCGITYERKHKIEYHVAHNKINGSHPQDQETEQQQPQNEYFQDVRCTYLNFYL